MLYLSITLLILFKLNEYISNAGNRKLNVKYIAFCSCDVCCGCDCGCDGVTDINGGEVLSKCCANSFPVVNGNNVDVLNSFIVESNLDFSA